VPTPPEEEILVVDHVLAGPFKLQDGFIPLEARQQIEAGMQKRAGTQDSD
jgi:hypothetical protein